MDRGKPPPKKPPIRRGLPLPDKIIPLGSKGRPDQDPKPTPSLYSDRKREASAPLPSHVIPPKTKLVGLTPLGRAAPEISRSSSSAVLHKPGIKTIEVPPIELVDRVLAADEAEDDESIDKILCGALKSLKTVRAKPSPALYLGLMYLAKVKPMFFESENVIETTCSLLKRDIGMSFKSKGNALVSVVACNLLMHAFVYEHNWPDIFVKVYLEDAHGERVWVDHPYCKEFVTNIQTAFGTKLASPHLQMATDPLRGSLSDVSGSGSPSREDAEGSQASSTPTLGSEEGDLGSESQETMPRYSLLRDEIEKDVVDFVKEQLVRRQGMDTPRNLLRLLTSTCGFSEVRLITAQRLEMWLQNPKLTRPAQELLVSTCVNCCTHSQEDVEVIGHLIKIRLKTKPLINHYLISMKELLSQHKENLPTVVKHVIYNELSNARNPNNMALLGALFQHSPELAAKNLAAVFQDLLMNRDDYLRALRALFREIVKALRYDVDFVAFCRGLMTEKTDRQFTELEKAIKDRMFASLCDLICLASLLSVTPQIREIVAAYTRGERKASDMESLRAFQAQVSMTQRDCVWWIHTIAISMFTLTQGELNKVIQKLVFLDTHEGYCSKDNWPQETDRGLLLSLLSEVPVQEDTLMRLLIMGLERTIPLAAGEALDLVDKLVKRAAVLQSEDFQVLKIERTTLIDVVLNSCVYHHPENITLPQGYQVPSLAIANFYWKGWILLLIMAAFNPSNIGRAGWDNYPILRYFMEMVMTNNFKFPMATRAKDDKTIEDLKNQELQVAQLEKQAILEFENLLARVQIMEGNSLLLTQLMKLEPNGPVRRPPIQILDQLQHYNKVLHLGHMLCRSRNPDFLLDIIQSQGTSQSMPWLAELVNSAEGSLDVLPVQCLCEFLINQEADKDGGGSDGGESSSSSKQKVHKQEQLLARLQSLVFDPNTDPRNTSEVLGYFLTRLSSKQQSARTLASKGLAMVLSPRLGEDAMEVEEPSDSDSPLSSHKWLLQDVPAIPNFETVKSQATTALRSACQIDTDPRAVSAYIIFLSHHVLPADLNELAQDLAQLIVERPTMLTCILPHEGASPAGDETLAAMLRIFSNYVIKAIKSTDEEEGYRWSESQDQVFLRWHSGESATMHILVVHAMIILLTYGEPKVKSEFTYLLGTWCPGNAPPPSAYLVDTSEEALLLPDWLKLRMIRSSVDQLVIAALQDLEPAQLVLFIQSFGIPVQSMSKLLAHLDAAVVQMPQAMDAAVVDKSYMAQLVEVQQMRGAQGGYQFLGLLNHQPKEEEKEDEKAMEVSDSEQEKKPTLDQTMLKDIQDQDQLKNLVLELVDLPQATTMSDKRDIWRNMQKAMLKERGVGDPGQTLCCRLIQALRSILTGDHAETFIEAILDHPSYPCSLLKHMASVQERKTPKSSQSDFIALLEMLQGTLPSTGQLVSTIKACMRRVKAGTRSQPEKVGEGDEARSLEKEMLKPPSQRNHLEDLLEECLGRNANKQTLNAHARASMLTRLMHQESDRKDSGFSSSKTQTSTCGLLMDWLTRIDPEVIRSCPDIQEEVMFRSRTLPVKDAGKVADSSGDGPGTGSGGSGYLLALLTHQTSWDTLHSCISFLLGREDAVERLDSTAVLDFLWACVHIPKIWQGRDTKAPKRYADENILMIDPRQLCTLADFIITECQVTSPILNVPSSPTSSSRAAGDGASRGGCPSPSARLPLLLNCCRGSAELIGSLVEHLSRKAQEASTSGSLYQNLLIEVYIQMPKALEKFMEDISTAGYRPHGIGASSYIDALVHRLLTVLSDRKRDENNKQKVEDANVICRKLATMHPLVFFRQLSLLVVLMRGRTQLNWREFRGSGHLGFFHHVVGLLSLLQPGLFQEDGKAVNGIMEAFFTVLQRYGSSKKPIESLVTRFVTLLYQYSSSNPSQARSVLQQNSATLNAMAQNHPNNTQLKSILASTSLSSSSKDQSEGSVLMAGDDPAPSEQLPFIEGIPGVGNREETYSPTPGAKGEGEESVWTPEFIRKMSAKLLTPNNMDDVIDALNEIEGASFRKHEMLHHFATEFASLMTSSNTECRAMAFCLTIRYLRYNPCCGEKCLPSYLDALASDDGCVVQTALKYLADFTALCQEQATTILQQAFLVGVHHKIDTVPPIAETLQLLSMDSTPTQSAS
ncbi:integrator complex subunit 1-like [Strongylocentrotus purpuratus]|uniref:Integrator complex subunit 1 n=1 Tax=Strongylocentrotus purpuratus TaxID=7668 RepID=A0A7M7NCY9_STRPU|nr:integrator complex subunit 1-like [Strongylocentrotus purpuratus]